MGAFAPSLPVGTLNVALATYAKSFTNNALVGDLIAPRVSVDRQSFQYLVFDRSNQRLDFQDLRAPGAVPQEIRMTYSVLPYFCRSRALRSKIPFEQEQYALGLGWSEKQKAVGAVMEKLLLSREAYIAALVLNPANVSNYQALSGASMWDSYLTGGTSHPIQVVEAAKGVIRQAGVQANGMILSDPVIVALQNHPDIIQRFVYTNGAGMIDLDFLSKCFGVPCTRAAAVALDKNNAGSFLWGTGAVLTYTSPVTSQADISALKTFSWSAAPGTVEGYGVLEFPDPNLDAKADIVSTDWYWDTRITGQEAMYVFNGCVQTPAFGNIPAPVVG